MRGFLLNENNIERGGFTWNMSGSVLLAAQSVIMLIPAAYVIGQSEAGVISIAYALAYLLFNIAMYGMRSFEASDAKHIFSFRTYAKSRVVTCIAMIIVAVIVLAVISKVNGYSQNKLIIVALMCVYKLIDAPEDIVHGYYQQYGRLDVAGRCLTLRLLVGSLCYIVMILLTKDMVLSLIVTVVISAIVVLVLALITFPVLHKGFRNERSECGAADGRQKGARELIIDCSPLFVGLMLNGYILQAPKYAIDAIMTDDVQAIFGYIFTPNFLIVLLSTVIFNPLIHRLAAHYHAGTMGEFYKIIRRQFLVLTGLTVLALIVGATIGLPILSFCFNSDLSMYRPELLILLLGGGIYAVSSFLLILITVVRAHKWVLPGYIIAAVVALALSSPLLKSFGLMGASILYLITSCVLSVSFAIVFVRAVRSRKM